MKIKINEYVRICCLIIIIAIVGISYTLYYAFTHNGEITYQNYGINQVTFFDDEGRILWERLVWKKPQWPVTLTVRQNETQYRPFAPPEAVLPGIDRQGLVPVNVVHPQPQCQAAVQSGGVYGGRHCVAHAAAGGHRQGFVLALGGSAQNTGSGVPPGGRKNAAPPFSSTTGCGRSQAYSFGPSASR